MEFLPCNVMAVAVLCNEYTFMILGIALHKLLPVSCSVRWSEGFHVCTIFFLIILFLQILLYCFFFHHRAYLYCIFNTILFFWKENIFSIKVYSELVQPRAIFLCTEYYVTLAFVKTGFHCKTRGTFSM